MFHVSLVLYMFEEEEEEDRPSEFSFSDCVGLSFSLISAAHNVYWFCANASLNQTRQVVIA